MNCHWITAGVRRAMMGAATVALLALPALTPAMAKDPLKIGAYLSETGPAANLGAGEMKVLKLFVDILNQGGGIGGQKVELFAYDDESDAAKANTQVKRLISSDGVAAVIGGTTTGATMSAIPLVERAGVPMLSCAGGAAIVEPVRATVFKMNPTDGVALSRIFDYLAKTGISKVAIIAGNDAFGQSATAAARKLSATTKIAIVGEEFFNPKDTDMTTQLTKLRQTDAQALLNFGFGDAAAIVAKNVVQLDIKLPHFGTHAIATDAFLKLAGPAAEGIAIPSGAILVWDQLPAGHPQKAVLEQFVSTYKAKYGEAPSFFAGNAYDALMLIKQAVEKAGDSKPASIVKALESGTPYTGVTGIFKITPTDHVGLGSDSMIIAQARGGAWRLVE